MNKSLMQMAQQQGASDPNEDTEDDTGATPADEGAEGEPPAGDSGGGASFKKPDITKFVPPELRDAVERVAAAGMKLMYAPEMRQDLVAAVKSPDPVPKVLSENITGLMLTLDQKSQGGIPQAVIFPAAMELLGEGATVLVNGGREVTQQDFNDAALAMYALIGKKLGGSDEDLMGAAAQSLQGGNPPPDDTAAAPPPDASAGAVPPQMQGA